MQAAQTSLLKDETARRRAELDQQVSDVERSYQKQIDAARTNAGAVEDPAQRQKFLSLATELEGQQAEQVKAIRQKAADDLAQIDEGRLQKVKAGYRELLDAQAKQSSASSTLLAQQRDRELALAGSVPEVKLAIERRYGPLLTQLQEEQQAIAGKSARAQLQQNLDQQLKDAETAGAQRATLEKSARATYLAQINALEVSEQAETGSRLLAQEERVQTQRLAIYRKGLDARLSSLKDATGKEIAALERTIVAERAKAVASGDGSRVTLLDDGLKQIGGVKADNLKGFRLALTDATREATGLREELTSIARTPLASARSTAAAPFDAVVKGANKQLADLKKAYGQVAAPTADQRETFQAQQDDLTAIVTRATTQRTQAQEQAEAKYYRERDDKAQAAHITLSKRELDLGRLTIDGYAAVLVADRVYWETRKTNAKQGSEAREEADQKIRENEDERLRLENERRDLAKDAAAFQRDELVSAVELADSDEARAVALARLTVSDQDRLAALNTEIDQLERQGAHERELLTLKQERVSIQKELTSRQQEEQQRANELVDSTLARVAAENKLASKLAKTDSDVVAARKRDLSQLQGQLAAIDTRIPKARSKTEENGLYVERLGVLEQIFDLQQEINQLPIENDQRRLDLYKAQAQAQLILSGLDDDQVASAQLALQLAQADLDLAEKRLALATTDAGKDTARGAVVQASGAVALAQRAANQAPIKAQEDVLALLRAQAEARLVLLGLDDDAAAKAQLALQFARADLVVAQRRFDLAEAGSRTEAGKALAQATVNAAQAERALSLVPIELHERALRLLQAQTAQQLELNGLASDGVAIAAAAVQEAQNNLDLANERVVLAPTPRAREDAVVTQTAAVTALSQSQRALSNARLTAEDKALDTLKAQVLAQAQITGLSLDAVGSKQLDLAFTQQDLQTTQRRLANAAGLKLTEEQVRDLRTKSVQLTAQEVVQQRELAKAQVEQQRSALDLSDARRRAQAELRGMADDAVTTAQDDLDITRQRQALNAQQLADQGKLGLSQQEINGLLKEQADLTAQASQNERKLLDAQRARRDLLEGLAQAALNLDREALGGTPEARSAREAVDGVTDARLKLTQAERGYAEALAAVQRSQSSSNLEKFKTATETLTGAIAGQRTAVKNLASSYTDLLGTMKGVQDAGDRLKGVVNEGKEGPFNGNQEVDRFMAIQKRRDAAILRLRKALASGDKAQIAAATDDLATQEERYKKQAAFLKKNGVDLSLTRENEVAQLSDQVDKLGIQYDREADLLQQRADLALRESETARFAAESLKASDDAQQAQLDQRIDLAAQERSTMTLFRDAVQALAAAAALLHEPVAVPVQPSSAQASSNASAPLVINAASAPAQPIPVVDASRWAEELRRGGQQAGQLFAREIQAALDRPVNIKLDVNARLSGTLSKGNVPAGPMSKTITIHNSYALKVENQGPEVDAQDLLNQLKQLASREKAWNEDTC
ncbi:hypothetical protein [Deinococcus sp. QL22]|uniref:hypothetical protein n=1 Tax=Deinococcus sp. QL22 TaxID=2939437 RepID=UPI0020180B9E|nr:hypothetical protein [Deinococcus sp. QL22]UQN06279.1 hypothetical protein M1R55_15685 [Deinococcus sp. QL22]